MGVVYVDLMTLFQKRYLATSMVSTIFTAVWCIILYVHVCRCSRLPNSKSSASNGSENVKVGHLVIVTYRRWNDARAIPPNGSVIALPLSLRRVKKFRIKIAITKGHRYFFVFHCRTPDSKKLPRVTYMEWNIYIIYISIPNILLRASGVHKDE